MKARIFFRQSIRGKLIVLFTATAFLSVLMACATLWISQLVHYRRSLRTEESAMAQLVAESSAPALLFEDERAAAETLSVLRTDPRVNKACLYDKAGRRLAFMSDQTNGNCPTPVGEEMRFTHSYLLIFRQVALKGEPVGTLYLQVSLTEMHRYLLHFAATGVMVLLMGSAFALGIAAFLQRIISGPIRHLTRVAVEVSSEGNLQLRAVNDSHDEIGLLIDQFNAMMDRLQARDLEVQEARAGLEIQVQSRTKNLREEIAERKLVEVALEGAKNAAEEASRAKSAFLANMSHELRTPLNAIIGYSEMLHEDAESAGELSITCDLEKILSSARHLLGLISDVLDISKIEAGQMKVSLDTVSSDEILREILPTAEVLAQKNANYFQAEKALWHGALTIDPLRFRQCLLNLVSNACKFTRNGCISIGVRAEMREGKEWTLWRVQDTGDGIAPEDIEKLFRSFSQVDGSLTRRHGGSGLGLAISQQLCQAMGGTITVESTVGQGSTFTIHMPVSTTNDEQQVPALV